MTKEILGFAHEKGIVPEKEKGRNVEIVLVYLRHGHRGLEGDLTDLGRKETREVAHELNLKDYDIVKPYGSTAGPLKKKKVKSLTQEKDWDMGRSLETSIIFAQESLADGQEMHNPKPVDVVNYEKHITTRPYDHTKIYNSFIPDNYDELSDEEKVKAAKFAQKKTIEHLMSLDSPEALKYKKEVAGGYALPLIHFSKMSNKLKSGQKVLVPFGAHGGHMELLLQQTMVQEDDDGKRIIGFDNSDEIGGEIDPSEGFLIKVSRDENGKLKDYILTFFNKTKRPAGEFVLDANKVEEIANFYKSLHKDKLSLLKE